MALFKGDLLCPFLQDVISVSGLPRMCLWSFSSKYPTDHLLYHFENAYFEWKQKQAVFMHVSLNANELLLLAPFSRIGLCLYLRYCAKKHLFGFDYHAYRTEIMCFNSHISLNLWYTVFWAHTSETCAQKVAVIRHVSTKLSSLSCLIALKLSNTHRFMLKKHSRLCLWR